MSGRTEWADKIAAANRRWASQFRYRGQTFSPAVAELWTLGALCIG